MKDLANPAWMWLKALLLLFIGLVSGTLIFLEAPTWRLGLLLCLTIWGFCRAYYFAFYVVEKYIDSEHRFSGLISFCRYLIKKPQPGLIPASDRDPKSHCPDPRDSLP
jgi:hypothetical protein